MLGASFFFCEGGVVKGVVCFWGIFRLAKEMILAATKKEYLFTLCKYSKFKVILRNPI